jgi:hypothetical protein
MRTPRQVFLTLFMVLFLSGFAFAQAVGDYRSAASGNWSDSSRWEMYDGANWIAATAAPAGTENITVDGTDTVRVDIGVTISGYLLVTGTGIVEINTGSLTFGEGSTYEHARDAGNLPLASWGTGSTFLLTGTVQDAPANRIQDFYNVTFNTPNLGRNRDMGWNGNTIGGDIRVINTGAYRWQMTSATAGSTAEFSINGDVIVEAGQFTSQGSSNANTTFIIHHYGDINVTGGNFSIARGSQGSGSGTTTWYLYEGNFSMSNATTQNSNPVAGQAKFVFAFEEETQVLTLSNVTFGTTGLPIEVQSDVFLDMGASVVGGADIFTLSSGAWLQSSHPGGLNGNLQTTGAISLSKQAGYSFYGSEAQVPGTLLPDSVDVLNIQNTAGFTFNDTLTCSQLTVSSGAVLQIDTAGTINAGSGRASGTIVNKGVLTAASPLDLIEGSVYEHARNGGDIPSGTWNIGSTLLITGTVDTAPGNSLQNYHNITFNAPNLVSTLEMDLAGVIVGGTVNVINSGSAPAGISFNDTLSSSELVVASGAIVQIDAAGNLTTGSGLINGTIVNKGALTATSTLIFENGSVYEHARDAGSVPQGTWNEGSTFLLTGTVQDAPANRVQNFFNVTFNTPNLGRNRDMGWNGITIGGDILVISTGGFRWQMSSASAGATAQFSIIGDVIVRDGQFTVQGTGNANTTFIVYHYGDIIVTGGNFSIARGSQGSGSGTTTWYMYTGNIWLSNATTQNSNPTPGNAKFVFASEGGTHNLTLTNVTFASTGLPLEVGPSATLIMDTSVVGGSDIFILSPTATLFSGHPAGLDGNLQTSGAVTLSKYANYSFNGVEAQVPGALLPDSIAILSIYNAAGVSFNDTLVCTDLNLALGSLMQIDTAGSIAANGGNIIGTVVNKGVLTAITTFDFDDGSVYEHAQNGGSIPNGTWNIGSTLLMSGTVDTAPGNRNQNYYNITFNTPSLVSNRDMGLNNVTIGGDIRVVNTGLNRWQLTSAPATDTAIVTLMGDVIVEGGAFTSQGTSNGLTVFEIHQYGDVVVTGGNFSVARGSQPGGNTRWFLHEGNFSMSNATTQNSNPANAWFVFDKDTAQAITLSNVTYGGGGLAIEVAGGSTLDFGLSELGGSGLFILNEDAVLATAHAGGIGGTLQATVHDSLNVGAGYIFNGSAAQVTSTALPVVVEDLSINNAAGVVLSQETTINGILHLMAGEFNNTIPFTLGPGGSISYEGGSLTVDPSSVEENASSEIPTEFAMYQNYPNPFNPLTTIRFDVPNPADVTLKIYDIAGREVAVLLSERRDAGTYSINWNAHGYASGVYYYRMTAGDFISVRKLVLMK